MRQAKYMKIEIHKLQITLRLISLNVFTIVYLTLIIEHSKHIGVATYENFLDTITTNNPKRS